MAAYALDVNSDFHSSSVTTIDTAVCRLCGNDKLRNDLVDVVDILPTHTVTVFFLDGTYDHDLISFWNKTKILHDLCSISGGSHTAFLVTASTTIDYLVCFVSFIWILFPVVDVSDSNCIDMAIYGNDLVSIPHPADNVTKSIDLHLVITKFLHLFLDSVYNLLFFAALRWNCDHIPQKLGHCWTICFCSLLNCSVIHRLPPFIYSLLSQGFPYYGYANLEKRVCK